MKYQVVKTYVVEAPDEKKARLVVEELEKKNQQWLFLDRVSSTPVHEDGVYVWQDWFHR
jgi:hypothetical protein